MSWQPIETAPKDGTPILAYDGGIWVAWWFVTNERIKGWATLDHVIDDPTHWMPLPDPPHMSLKPCPKCGKKQPIGDRCVECGLEFAK
jgi:hypothetical protein